MSQRFKYIARKPASSPCPKGCGGEMLDRGFGKKPTQCDLCREKAKNLYTKALREQRRAKRQKQRAAIAEKRRLYVKQVTGGLC